MTGFELLAMGESGDLAYTAWRLSHPTPALCNSVSSRLRKSSGVRSGSMIEGILSGRFPYHAG